MSNCTICGLPVHRITTHLALYHNVKVFHKDKYQCPDCDESGPNDVWLQWHWNFFHKKIDLSEYDTNFGPIGEALTKSQRKILS